MEQFGMSRQLRLPGQQKDQFWRAVVLCALTAAVFFLPFYIMDGGFFHYAGDFNSQQISFYRYMNGFSERGRLPGQHLCRGTPQHLLLGNGPGQRCHECLLLLPVRLALLLVLACCSRSGGCPT